QAAGSVAITALAGATGQAAEPSKAVTAGSQSRLKRLPRVKPEEIRLDSRRLQVAYDLLEKWTAGPDAPIPGAAILVGRFGRIVPPRFFGRQGPERDAGPI